MRVNPINIKPNKNIKSFKGVVDSNKPSVGNEGGRDIVPVIVIKREKTNVPLMEKLAVLKRIVVLNALGITCDDFGNFGHFKDIVSDKESYNDFMSFLKNLSPEMKKGIRKGKIHDFGFLKDTLQFKDKTSRTKIAAKQYYEGGKYISSTTFFWTIDSDGKYKVERFDKSPEDCKIVSHAKGGNSIFHNAYLIDEYLFQNEICLDKDTKEPVGIRNIKCSYVDRALLDETYYELKNYPEEFDILSALQNDEKIEGGKEISKTTRLDDGGIEYVENSKCNGCTTKRHYIEHPSGKSEYSYHIFDENNKEIMALDRTFEKTPRGSITTLNGDKTELYFFDHVKDVWFTTKDGTGKYSIMSVISNNEDLWKMLKNAPADIVYFICRYIDRWSVCENGDDGINSDLGVMRTSLNPWCLYHEIGHEACSCRILEPLELNEELVKTYKEELEAFEERNTQCTGINQLGYFSLTGGSCDSGLDELIAETRALLTTVGNLNSKTLIIRMQLLERNFPKTIALISSMLGLNGINKK